MKDLTTGSEYKALFLFSLPILIGNLFQQFYNVADSIIVGLVLGKENLAAVGFCFQFNLILVALSMGLTLGMGILISRCFGAKEHAAIGAIIDTGFLFSILLALVVSALGVASCDALIRLFQVPPDTAPFAATYLRIIFMGAVPSFLYNTMTNILRGLGDSKGPVYFLIGAALLNVALDILLVNNWGAGIAGAAYATVLSQIFAFLGSFFYMRRRYPAYPIHLLRPSFRLAVLKDILRINIPSAAQQVFKSLGFLVLQGIVNGFGSTCMAAYAAVTKIDSFAQLPALNLGQALSNFTAQNRGANREDRARKGLRAALVMSLGLTITISCIVVPFAVPLIRLFSSDPDVLAIGKTYLYIVGLFYCVDAAMQMLNGILLGYEKPLVPMLSTIVSLCIMQVPAALLLSSTSMGYTGIWAATPFGWIGGVLIRLYYYKKYVVKTRES